MATSSKTAAAKTAKAEQTEENVEKFKWVKPLVLRSIIGSLVVGAIIGVISVVIGEFNDVSRYAVTTVLLFLSFSLMIWWDGIVSGRRSSAFGYASIAVSAYLLLVGIQRTWLPGEYESVGMNIPDLQLFFGWVGLALIARFALAHTHLLLYLYEKFEGKGMIWLSRATFLLMFALAVLLSLPILLDGVPAFEPSDVYWRATAAIAILDGLGTALMPLIYGLFIKPGAKK